MHHDHNETGACTKIMIKTDDHVFWKVMARKYKFILFVWPGHQLNKDVFVPLSDDYSTERYWTAAALRQKSMTTERNSTYEHAVWRRTSKQIQREVNESVPWIMWWTRLSSVDELDGLPTALAVLHKDRHRILATRQRAGQGLARSLCRPFHTARPQNPPCAFSRSLVERVNKNANYNLRHFSDTVFNWSPTVDNGYGHSFSQHR